MKALEGDADCGNLLSYGFYSGEHIVGLSEGCPTFMHPANANFNLANFMRVHLYTAFAAMKIGMDILMQQEKVEISQILGHGGIFKTENVAQNLGFRPKCADCHYANCKRRWCLGNSITRKLSK